MSKYFSTFITGFSDIVEEELERKLGDVNVVLISDGVVVYDSNQPTEMIRGLCFFNNSYNLIKFFDHFGIDNPISEMTHWLKSQEDLRGMIAPFVGKGKTFKLVFSNENQFVALNKERLGKLENLLADCSGLVLDRQKADLEFWFLSRKEGFGFFGIRLTRRSADVPERGELKPELAHILCLLSEPEPSDVFLDPFAGHGAIPIERARFFPYKKIIAGDIKPSHVKKVAGVEVRRLDALNLVGFAESSIDKIVTDPPWGMYMADADLKKLYSGMLNEFRRILRPGGIALVLTAQEELLEEAIIGRFDIERKWNTLVNGKKAAVYKLRIL